MPINFTGRGHYVRVLDDLSSGDPASLVAGVNFNRGDVRDVPKLWSLLQGVEVVYHLAARVSVPASVLYPREYNEVNVGGTVSLLEACRDVGSVNRVVLASSATVYGDHSAQPVDEDRDIRPAAFPMRSARLAAEQYLFTLGRLGGFETVALRIFNAYGPGQDVPPAHAPVIPQFVQQIAGHGSVVVNGDGSQTRDFVYIDDVVDALISAGSAPDVDGQIINVGSGEETAIRDLVALIGKITGTGRQRALQHRGVRRHRPLGRRRAQGRAPAEATARRCNWSAGCANCSTRMPTIGAPPQATISP